MPLHGVTMQAHRAGPMPIDADVLAAQVGDQQAFTRLVEGDLHARLVHCAGDLTGPRSQPRHRSGRLPLSVARSPDTCAIRGASSRGFDRLRGIARITSCEASGGDGCGLRTAMLTPSSRRLSIRTPMPTSVLSRVRPVAWSPMPSSTCLRTRGRL